MNAAYLDKFDERIVVIGDPPPQHRPGWLTFTAHRPLYGTWDGDGAATWEAWSVGAGIFFAQIDPADPTADEVARLNWQHSAALVTWMSPETWAFVARNWFAAEWDRRYSRQPGLGTSLEAPDECEPTDVLRMAQGYLEDAAKANGIRLHIEAARRTVLPDAPEMDTDETV